MNFIKFFNSIIGLPDRRKTGCLCSHNINADSEIRAETCHSRSHKFHDFILHITICKNFSDNSQRNVLRTNSRPRFTFQVNSNNTRHIDVISLRKKLFYQLTSAFSHCHGSQSAISGMTVRAKNHFSASGQHFTGILVNHGLMRRYINTAVFFCTGKSKHMVIFIDRSAYCTQRVMAVCQYIGNREFFQTGRSGRLNNSYKGNIMRCQFIEFNLQFFHVTGSIVSFQNSICHRIFRCLFPGYRLSHAVFFYDIMAVYKINTAFVQFHNSSSIHKIWSV